MDELLSRDGVRLAFERVDGQKAPVIFVHGWCCDHEFFAPQLAYFADRGHQVLALDLRGHGRSDKPVQPYTMPSFADDIAWLCGELKLPPAILVGHSMGGIVAFDLAVRYPELVAAVAMLDAAIVVPDAAWPGIAGMIASLRAPTYRAALIDYVARALILPSDDKTRAHWILERMSSAPQHVMVSAFEGLRDYDPDIGGRRLDVPALYISADEAVARTDMARLQQLVPTLAHGRTVGSGHFCQLEVPDQVNAMLNRFIDLTRPDGARSRQ
ncbi:hypothetical protein VW23_018395 [Devosia insulae DS-56]|uniref:AB hydrolase-1 domain-containing protein n=2 Tax=Devosia insulae TaxID=408174 RepID=A0A1E5XR32_9HYPH|nr:hypothetical protein VW23_018395 [Devosia insulae DS-56]